MLRITIVSQSPDVVVLQLEGWVADETVEVLAEEGQRWLQRAQRLELELRGVKFIDEAGLALLQGWAGPRLVLRGASAYLQSVLAASGLKKGGNREPH